MPSAMSRRRKGGVSFLPEDILSNILIRLPAKSIGKSRCVSKHWNSLLTTPRFINTHLARSHSHPQKSLMLLHCKLFFSFTLHPEDGVVEGDFQNRVLIRDRFNKKRKIPDRGFVGHCNGLVLMGVGPCYLLLNPITGSHFRLTHPPVFDSDPSGPGTGLRIGDQYGFGYDSSAHDYKVVDLFVVSYLPNYENAILDMLVDPKVCKIYADVYSVINKCWRRVEFDHRPFVTSDVTGVTDGSGVFVNGALHWYCILPGNTIVSLDLATEKFSEFPSIGLEKGRVDRLVVTKGGSCLGLACWDKKEGRIDVWTMNEYGIAESWTKNVVVGFGKRSRFWRDAIVFRDKDRNELRFYSFNDDKHFTLDLRIDDGYKIDGLMFTESLVSPLSLCSYSTT